MIPAQWSLRLATPYFYGWNMGTTHINGNWFALLSDGVNRNGPVSLYHTTDPAGVWTEISQPSLNYIQYFIQNGHIWYDGTHYAYVTTEANSSIATRSVRVTYSSSPTSGWAQVDLSPLLPNSSHMALGMSYGNGYWVVCGVDTGGTHPYGWIAYATSITGTWTVSYDTGLNETGAPVGRYNLTDIKYLNGYWYLTAHDNSSGATGTRLIRTTSTPPTSGWEQCVCPANAYKPAIIDYIDGWYIHTVNNSPSGYTWVTQNPMSSWTQSKNNTYSLIRGPLPGTSNMAWMAFAGTGGNFFFFSNDSAPTYASTWHAVNLGPLSGGLSRAGPFFNSASSTTDVVGITGANVDPQPTKIWQLNKLTLGAAYPTAFTAELPNDLFWEAFLLALSKPMRLGARNDGNGVTERHSRINTVRQEWSSDLGNRLQHGQKGTYQ